MQENKIINPQKNLEREREREPFFCEEKLCI